MIVTISNDMKDQEVWVKLEAESKYVVQSSSSFDNQNLEKILNKNAFNDSISDSKANQQFQVYFL